MTGKPYLMRLGLGFRAAQEPGSRPRRGRHGRRVGGVGDALRGRRRGLRHQPGSFAEYAAAPRGQARRKPPNLSFAQAAVVPISAGTALQALGDAGRVQARPVGARHRRLWRRRQLRRPARRRRSGPRSPASAAQPSSTWCGRWAPTTSSTTPARTTPTAPPLRPDPRHRRQSLAAPAAAGARPSRARLSSSEARTAETSPAWAGSSAGRCSPSFLQQRLACSSPRSGRDFERLTELIEAGLVRPTVDRVFPLEEAQQAMRLLEQGRVRGKVAITV